MKKSILAWFSVRRNKVILGVLSVLLTFSGVVWGCYHFGYGGFLNGKLSHLKNGGAYLKGKVVYAEGYLKKAFHLEKITRAWGGNKVAESDSQVKGVSSEADSGVEKTVEGRLKMLEAQFDGFLLREKSNQVGIEGLKSKLEAAIAEVTKSNALLVEQNKNLVSQLSQLQNMNSSNNNLNSATSVAGTGEKVNSSPLSQKININTASETELDSLDGIGPSIAKKIIDYRVANGGFKTIEGIMDVSGIGESIFGKIKDKIQV